MGGVRKRNLFGYFVGKLGKEFFFLGWLVVVFNFDFIYWGKCKFYIIDYVVLFMFILFGRFFFGD